MCLFSCARHFTGTSQLEDVGYRIVVPATINAGQLFYVRVPRTSVEETLEGSAENTNDLRSTVRSSIRDGEPRERQVLGQRIENAIRVLRQSLPEALPHVGTSSTGIAVNRSSTGEWVF